MRVLTLVAAVALVVPVPASMQSPAPGEHGPLVIGARSFSPIVENVDAVMKFYAALGLKAPPPDKGDTYPWDEEAWHYELHGGQAPRSQMRFTYATVPGAVPPATPLLVEPVEHRNIDRKPHPMRVQDPGTTTLVLLVRDIEAAARALPSSSHEPTRRVTVYGGSAKAMTVTVPGAHLVELLQLDPLPQTTAAADTNVIGAWVRVTVEDLERTLRLYQDAFGLPFTELTVTNAALGNLIGESTTVKVRLAGATLPGTRMRLEFLEVSGVGRHRLAARIQDPGAARLQLTVRNIDEAMTALRNAGPSTVVSNGIITQPQYRVAVASDLNGLFLVLTDQRAAQR
jgi:catechol 2,3-dioxygenase-like lactoylglutathione lyase family enzyme